MEYYFISLIISIVIFIFIYIIDKKTPNEEELDDDYNYQINNKTLFNTNNILLFIIIYIVTTIISFYTFTSSFNINSLIPIFLLNLIKMPEPIKEEKIINNIDVDEIDPKILNKINDNINIGFNPPIIEENENEIENQNQNEIENKNEIKFF